MGVGAGDPRKVDHKDGDGLNNRRGNLRFASAVQNGQNRRKHKASASRFKGVSLASRGKRWRAGILVDGRQIWLGRFDTEEEAAVAYNQAALRYFGEFACLNEL